MDKQQDDSMHERVAPMEKEIRQRAVTASDISVIRSSTPRPPRGGFNLAEHGLVGEPPPSSFFPESAPAAPPLPEETDAKGESTAATSGQRVSESEVSEEQEFVWLFEYALEMDATLLNSPECLDGQALLYGPAVLRGYTIQIGAVAGDFGSLTGNKRTIATIVPGAGTHAEVWGVLYRVPRSLTSKADDEFSLLDAAHGAIAPHHLFQAVKAVVHESYRGRDISCITYIATERVRQHLRLSSSESNALFVQRIAAIARGQRLPESYVQEQFVPVDVPSIKKEPGRERSFMSAPLPMTRLNTEGRHAAFDGAPSTTGVRKAPALFPRAISFPGVAYDALPWLLVFACYLSTLFLVILVFALCQGLTFGNSGLSSDLTLLGVPWLVFVYGLLGGCISCIVSVGRLALSSESLLSTLNRSTIVIVTWFSRPFIGAVLGLLMYLFLNSGIFMFEGMLATHPDILLLCAALAGLCENRLFGWKRRGDDVGA
ncbi:gamma-glutamylcyclotransferase family protein [Ktedonospora formicarum]|uniref:Uncharacterized protein n=1 Tax=Ktedonospora formicarum TaxID=2778364 RepID=A0A8J3I0U8_9CHLR|nr:gamma-glutamylcyclotransferase family protein [Ktedonospora formicarum]GHO43474.1 hypothetical protein KSX_16370 [Ktedonospora formicarum]